MRVTWIDKDHLRRTEELEGPEVHLGRSRSCQFNDPSDEHLSRHHARLVRVAEGWQVLDLGSKNKTYLNGLELKPNTPMPVKDGDQISVGNCKLHLGTVHDPMPAITPLETSTTEHTIHTLQVTGGPSAGVTRVLIEASREIVSSNPAQEVMRSLLELAMRATGAERGMVAAVAPGGTLVPIVWLCPGSELPPRPSRSVMKSVIEEGKAVIIHDTWGDQALAPDGTIMSAGIRSVLCAPLGSDRPAWGVMYLDSQRGIATFGEEHLQVVSILAGMVHIVHEHEENLLRELEMRSLQAQLSAAAQMQAMLLPKADLVPPPGFRVAGANVASLMIGGDIYDFFSANEGFGVMLADVAGKGLPAALLMANLHAWWHAVTELGMPCTTFLTRLNDEMLRWLPDNRFITMAYAVADSHGHELTFASAGHTTALLVSPDGSFERLEPTGPPLGLLRGAPFTCERRPFQPGQRLILFSDGVSDQRNVAGADFGVDRLILCVQKNAARDPASIVSAIFDEVAEHRGAATQDDDTTVAVLSRE